MEFELYTKKLRENINALKKYTKKRVFCNIERIYSNLQNIEKSIFFHLTAWQHVEIARGVSRFLPKDYINLLFTDFQELSGDRIIGDDKAIIGGLARLDENAVMIIGQQKGKSLKERSKTLFGMTSPSGFRKSLRLMEIAERFNIPIITFIDTPGADPGASAEKNNQSCAIAYSLLKMPKLTVPIVSIVTGEGCSGGALAVSVGDVVLMLQYSYYSVLSPEGCSLILQRKKDNREYFADILCLTSEHLYSHGLIHDIIPEYGILKRKLLKEKIREYVVSLLNIDKESLIKSRIEHWKFS